jgi:hypothetical protein
LAAWAEARMAATPRTRRTWAHCHGLAAGRASGSDGGRTLFWHRPSNAGSSRHFDGLDASNCRLARGILQLRLGRSRSLRELLLRRQACSRAGRTSRAPGALAELAYSGRISRVLPSSSSVSRASRRAPLLHHDCQDDKSRIRSPAKQLRHREATKRNRPAHNASTPKSRTTSHVSSSILARAHDDAARQTLNPDRPCSNDLCRRDVLPRRNKKTEVSVPRKSPSHHASDSILRAKQIHICVKRRARCTAIGT